MAEVLRLANLHRFPVVPRGAATWGLGGAVPMRNGVVLDLTSLDSIAGIDAGKGLVTVSSGATWQKVIDAARREGLHIGTYPSSFPAATVGGWIAVGGVGIGTLGHGRIQENLASLQVVLPQGGIEECHPASEAGGLPLDTFVGTEGVLGVVTRAVIRARPLPERTLPLAFTFPALADAAAFLGRLPFELSPTHVMFADRANFEWLEAAGISTGVRTALVTVILEGEAARVESEAKRAEDLARSTGGGCAPSEVAQRQWTERSREYRMRRAGTGSLPGQVLLPLTRLGEAVERTYALLRRFRLNAAMRGTLADRDTFMLVPYYLIDERRQARTLAAMTFNYHLTELAFSLGGRPMGLGMYLPFLLHKDRGSAEARRLLELKKRLDPNGVLNPGKLLESQSRSGRRISPWLSVLAMRMGRVLRSTMARESFPVRADIEGPGTRAAIGDGAVKGPTKDAGAEGGAAGPGRPPKGGPREG